MLNFIYYPVSFILWAWHKAFSFVFGDGGWAGGISWALAVVFLVFTLRAFLYKPFVSQVRSMRKMQEFQPEIAKLRKKYANDKQKQAAEMQRLQKEHGVNPVAGCLPVLVQLPVFIGLFHVLRSFGPINDQGVPVNLDGSVRTQNYFFDQAGVLSFNNASLFGAKLGSWVTQGSELLEKAGTTMTNMIIVMIPLMIAAGIFTHITARHSVARQVASGQGMDNPQTAIMQKLMLYVFPIGVVVGAPFLPLSSPKAWAATCSAWPARCSASATSSWVSNVMPSPTRTASSSATRPSRPTPSCAWSTCALRPSSSSTTNPDSSATAKWNHSTREPRRRSTIASSTKSRVGCNCCANRPRSCCVSSMKPVSGDTRLHSKRCPTRASTSPSTACSMIPTPTTCRPRTSS